MTPSIKEALERLIADIEDYERVNNLAPSPGKKDCWQSVTNAKAAIATLQPSGERREAIARVIDPDAGWGIQLDGDYFDLREAQALYEDRQRRAIDKANTILASGLVQDEADWRDISSAPKDGTEILLFSDHRFGTKTPTVCSWWTAERCAENDGGDPADYKADWYSVDDEYDCFCRPTHWMPLPAPPIRSARDGGAS